MLLEEEVSIRKRPGAGAISSITQFCQRYQAVVIPTTIALVSRLIVFIAADLIMRLALGHRRDGLPWSGPLSVWDRKDAGWYISIAQYGYTYSTRTGSRANFFPLYPALEAIFGRVALALHLPAPYILAGMAISWVTFAIACIALYRFTLNRFGRRVAIGAILLLCAFPFSLYYGAPYTESIYLALGVGAFLAMDQGRWWTASALAGLASASRPPGLIIGACVALAYALDWWQTRHPLRLNVLSLALTPLGTAAYMFYCYVRWGDPLAYIKTSRAGWNGGHLQLGGVRYVAHVIRHPVSWIGTRDPNHILAAIAIFVMLTFLALVPFTWRLLGPVFTFFSLASIFSPILNFPNANSIGRYLSVIFPVFIVLAYLLRDRPRILTAFCVGSGIVLILFATYFIAGYGLS